MKFSSGSKTANLVIGQVDFISGDESGCSFSPQTRPLNKLCTPTLAKINPETGDLYVIDESSPGFQARILKFSPPFSNGISALKSIFPNQIVKFDIGRIQYYFQATGLTFNTYRQGEYANGVFMDK